MMILAVIFCKKGENNMSSQDQMKYAAAEAALSYVDYDGIIGIGSGSTVNCFIELLASVKSKIEAAVSCSAESSRRLKAIGIPVVDLNTVDCMPIYIDGADEINSHLQMIKGGGAALTSEKIVASVADKFICIADSSKKVDLLGKFPLPIEAIPQARSAVARQLVKLGAQPVYRQGVITDHGNVILDVQHLDLTDPVTIERQLNDIPGVVTNGIFACRPANVLLLSTSQGTETVRL